MHKLFGVLLLYSILYLTTLPALWLYVSLLRIPTLGIPPAPALEVYVFLSIFPSLDSTSTWDRFSTRFPSAVGVGFAFSIIHNLIIHKRGVNPSFLFSPNSLLNIAGTGQWLDVLGSPHTRATSAVESYSLDLSLTKLPLVALLLFDECDDLREYYQTVGTRICW